MDNEVLNNEEEETSILTLTDENGVDTDFEYLDCIPYEGKEYLVLLPADEAATDVVILEVEPVDEETENYLSVQDEDLLNAVYDIFKEKYKGILKSVDGNNFVVTAREKVKVEGKKRPVLSDVDHAFQMDKVKYTKYLLSFK